MFAEQVARSSCGVQPRASDSDVASRAGQRWCGSLLDIVLVSRVTLTRIAPLHVILRDLRWGDLLGAGRSAVSSNLVFARPKLPT